MVAVSAPWPIPGVSVCPSARQLIATSIRTAKLLKPLRRRSRQFPRETERIRRLSVAGNCHFIALLVFCSQGLFELGEFIFDIHLLALALDDVIAVAAQEIINGL